MSAPARGSGRLRSLVYAPHRRRRAGSRLRDPRKLGCKRSKGLPGNGGDEATPEGEHRVRHHRQLAEERGEVCAQRARRPDALGHLIYKGKVKLVTIYRFCHELPPEIPGDISFPRRHSGGLKPVKLRRSGQK